MNFQVFLRKS